MIYELLPTGRGVLIDRASVFCDVKGSAELSFLLPDEGQFAAVLLDEHGATYDDLIVDGKLVLPNELLKQQTLQLYVVKTDEGQITMTYACEPLQIHSLAAARADVFELTGAATEDDLRLRMTEIEKQFCTQMQKFEEYTARVDELEAKLIAAIERFNGAVETIKDTVERVTELEEL